MTIQTPPKLPTRPSATCHKTGKVDRDRQCIATLARWTKERPGPGMGGVAGGARIDGGGGVGKGNAASGSTSNLIIVMFCE